MSPIDMNSIDTLDSNIDLQGVLILFIMVFSIIVVTAYIRIRTERNQ